MGNCGSDQAAKDDRPGAAAAPEKPAAAPSSPPLPAPVEKDKQEAADVPAGKGEDAGRDNSEPAKQGGGGADPNLPPPVLKPKEKIQLPKKKVYSDYKVRPQKRIQGWNAASPEDDVAERDITDGRKYCYLIHKKDYSQLALFNNSDNLEITVEMGFGTDVLEPATEEAESLSVRPPRKEGDKFVATLFPGETVPLAKGVDEHTWTGGYSLAWRSGPVTDKEYLAKVAARVSARRSDDMEMMRKVAAALDYDPDKVPAANSAEYDYRVTHALAAAVMESEDCDEDTRFVDLAFPPVEASIGVPGRPKLWVCPKDYLGKRGQLFVKGTDAASITPGDIDQGVLGDCWFMAALAACAEFPNDLVVPMFKEAEEAAKSAEANIFHVRLAKNGWFNWYVVDGYFPCHVVPNPEGPCFARNKEQPEELWVTLLEKAYAKVHGCYNNISSGDPAVGLSDLTGYPSRSISLDDPEEEVYRILKYHDDQKHCIFITSPGVDITLDDNASEENKAKAAAYAEMGLVPGHAYTVLEVCEWTDASGKTFRLAKVRNPWGTGKEWAGTFRDSDDIWQKDTPDVQELIALTRKDVSDTGAQSDGTWWMEFKDMQKMFGHCGACFVNLDWWDVRIRTGIADSAPLHIVEMKPTTDMNALAWVTQPDKRGLPEDDPRRKYSALRLQIVKQAGKTVDDVAVSNKGVFMYGASCVAFETGVECDFDGYFEFDAGETYYAVVRGHPGEEVPSARSRNDLNLCIITSRPCNMKIYETTPEALKSFGYKGYYGFSVAGGKDVSSDVLTQVNKVNTQGGHPVDWDNIESYPVKPQGWQQEPKTTGRRISMHRKSVG